METMDHAGKGVWRQDGYMNMLSRYGTARDNVQAWNYTADPAVLDMQLMHMYEGNGLFAKIIDRPSEEAVKHGLDLELDEEVKKLIDEKLDHLEWEEKAMEALAWCRLFGGAVIVMLVDDGHGLEEPLDLRAARRIEELLVFDRSVIQPDYISMYGYTGSASAGAHGTPQWFQISSLYGTFRVHESRCMVFRNGHLPERTTQAQYRYWGMPEYCRMREELREVVTGHGYSVRMLEKCVQAVYKMKNLAAMLATEAGEEKVLKRLETIDLARSILSSLAIDADGEEYAFQNMSISGVKDILDGTCNMLSAVTDIPQTILFGRSPAGMNATGESDLENYYNMVERIQRRNLKKNVRVLLELILREFMAQGKISEIPEYEVKFTKLWSTSAMEQADIDSKNAATELTKAQTAQVYLDMQAIDPNEIRGTLKDGEGFSVGSLDLETDAENQIDFSSLFQEAQTPPGEGQNGQAIFPQASPGNSLPGLVKGPGGVMDGSSEDYTGTGVLVIRDGKILIGRRSGGEGWCGPGGHIEAGENPEDAAVREAMEEFGIWCENLEPFGECGNAGSVYGRSKQFLCRAYEGEPAADGQEMTEARFVTPEELMEYPLFPPFAEAWKQYRKYADSG